VTLFCINILRASFVSGNCSLSAFECAYSAVNVCLLPLLNHVTSFVLYSGVIDPVQWKQETDRVAAKLSAGVRRGGAGGVLGLGGVSGGSEWADHIDALKAYAALKSNSNSGGAGVSAGTTAADDRCVYVFCVVIPLISSILSSFC